MSLHFFPQDGKFYICGHLLAIVYLVDEKNSTFSNLSSRTEQVGRQNVPVIYISTIKVPSNALSLSIINYKTIYPVHHRKHFSGYF
nr:hypothetical protein [uncultured Apibacter sp.]